MSLYRIEQERKDRPTLLSGGGQRRPDAFAPAAAGRHPQDGRASPLLRDVPVNDDEAHRLLRQVVGRVDARRAAEAEVRFPVLAEPLSPLACLFRLRHAGRGGIHYLFPYRLQRLLKPWSCLGSQIHSRSFIGRENTHLWPPNQDQEALQNPERHVNFMNI